MSYFLRVLCQSDSRFTVRTISDFLRDGQYFETMPHVEAVPSQALDSQFERIDVVYDGRKRPIIITSTVGKDLTEELSELTEMARRAGISSSILQHITSTRQIVAIEVDRDHLTEEAWRFCDCLEAFIASELKGIVFAPEDGFYDKRLQLMQRV